MVSNQHAGSQVMPDPESHNIGDKLQTALPPMRGCWTILAWTKVAI